MRDHHERARVVHERALEHLARAHVEMVRGLVEHQHVRRAQQQLREREPRLLAAGQHGHLLPYVVAREQEGAEVPAQARLILERRAALELFEHGATRIERVELVLRVEGHLHLVADLALALLEGQHAREQAQQRGLAGAVGADQRHLLAAPDLEAHAAIHHLLAVGLVHLDQLERHRAGPRRLGDREAHPARGGGRRLHSFELVERLDAALHLARLRRLGAEALDEALGLGHLAVLRAALGFGLLPPALALGQVEVPAAREERQAPVRQLGHARGVAAQEGAVVRDQHHAPAKRGERLVEPLERGQVEVIGGLVEQQHLRILEQQLRQLDAHQPAAREARERARARGGVEAEPLEHALDSRLAREGVLAREACVQGVIALGEGCGHVAVRGRDAGLELAQLRLERVEVREGAGGLGLDRARPGGVDLLPQQRHARAARAAALAAVRRLGACRDAQQRRFADAVGAHQRDAVARAHLEIHAREQRAAAECAGDAGQAKRHGRGR